MSDRILTPEEELNIYRKKAEEVALDFKYGTVVIDAIEKAKTEGEIVRIMYTARHSQD